MKKIFILIFILFISVSILSFKVLTPKQVSAGASDNVSGWAWSETIGWISFNSISDGSAIGYGVSIDPNTGEMSGHAWSENIGWISFDKADLSGCPFGQCVAKVSPTSFQMSGWARALSPITSPEAGGWGGWISLRGANYGVDFNNLTGEFSGFAYGGGDSNETGTIGWISFNCLDQGGCGVSDYKVVSSLRFNTPPSANNLTANGISYCANPRQEFSWDFQDAEDGPNQTAYQLQVDRNGDWVAGNGEFDSGYTISSSELRQIYITPVSSAGTLDYNTTYSWRVKVWDSDGADSGWIYGSNFTTPKHKYPSPNFSVQSSPSTIGEVVEFPESSDCYDSSNNSYKCVNSGSIDYKWDFDYNTGIDYTIRGGNASTTYATQGIYTVRLNIIDNTLTPAGTCYYDQQVQINRSLPNWKEISP